MRINIKYFTISCMISLLIGFAFGLLICVKIIKNQQLKLETIHNQQLMVKSAAKEN